MTKHRSAHAQDFARPAAESRRHRRTPAQPRGAARPGAGALAAVGVGLLLLVGVGGAMAPRVSESGAGEAAYALWSDPVPSFLATTGRAAVTSMRGLVPADPPRVLGVPDTATSAAQKSGGGARSSGSASGAVGTASSERGSGAARTESGSGVRGASGAASTSDAANGARRSAPQGASTAGTAGAATTNASAVVRAPATTAPAVPIRVYFSRHPDSDATFTAVSPVKRSALDRGVAAAALAELIDGPTTEERAAGYYSELGRSLSGPSSCDGRDFQLSIRDGVATVRFCRVTTSAGIGQDARVRAQIEATLTQFSTIRSVRLLGSDGHCLFDESGLDRCLTGAAPAPPSARSTTAR